MRHLLVGFILSILIAVSAQAFETQARGAIVIDLSTGTVLLDKNADEPQPPASMSKLMTLYMAFEAIRDGRLQLDEKLPVSAHAMSFGGSTMFLDTTDRVSVEDLLRGIIVLSGNDACVVIAEALSPDGTEAGFARLMTQRAQQLGMTNSIFQNASGWPATGHVMSARDLALLGRLLIQDFPEFYPMFAETEFEFDGRAPQNTQNRNPLLRLNIGADGLKTGHTQRAGYGLVGSAKQGDRRVIFVVNGLSSARQRAVESEAILSWAFRQFVERPVVSKGTTVAEADVWMGRQDTVALEAMEDVTTLLPVLSADGVAAEVIYDGPLHAPVMKGDHVAKLVIMPEGLPELEVPLYAADDVPAGGFMIRLKTVSKHILARLQAGPEAETSAAASVGSEG
ncbi:MAG: D-alanyl-D-alanine carboxypeptidase family protein [Pseudomonadota bacterium]